tara:strand:- start:4788 stop:6794 length:2007 start_codon:yes stop_codon:yes gene_type:complete
MVFSIIKPDKEYEMNKDVDYDDLNDSANVYVINDKEIILGNIHSEVDLSYHYVYLVVNDEPKEKIGVFEIESNKSDKVESSLTNELEFSLSDGKLLYFSELKHEKEDEKEEETNNNEDYKISEDDIEILPKDKDIDDDVLKVKGEDGNELEKEESIEGNLFIDKKIDLPPLLQKENEKSSDDEKTKFKSSDKNEWVENFFQNNNYSIVDNEGGGDCLFATIRDAYRGIGKETTVDKLRKLVSEDADETQFEEYRNMYLTIAAELNQNQKQMKEIESQLRKLKQDQERSNDKEISTAILIQMKEFKTQYEMLKRERNNSRLLMNEFNYMKDINTFEDYKNFMQTSAFWGDTVVVSTLERKLNIKIVLLSEESWDSEDVDSVMNCGHLNDSQIEESKIFKPDYYVILAYTGNHYKLIQYKNKGLLKFIEIPYDVKSLIVNKCLEKNSGPYYLIPDFRNLKREMGLDPDMGEIIEDIETTHGLYEDNDVFMYYANSKNAKAGKGSNEKLDDKNIMKYAELNSINGWRRMLDDSYLAPFTTPDGLRWNSVKHYYLGAQFKKGYPDIYEQFSLKNESDISKKIKSAIVFSDENKDKIDSDFYEQGVEPRYETERYVALYAKFNQNKDLKKVLMETKKAKLTIFNRRQSSRDDIELMKLRKNISVEDNRGPQNV